MWLISPNHSECSWMPSFPIIFCIPWLPTIFFWILGVVIKVEAFVQLDGRAYYSSGRHFCFWLLKDNTGVWDCCPALYLSWLGLPAQFLQIFDVWGWKDVALPILSCFGYKDTQCTFKWPPHPLHISLDQVIKVNMQGAEWRTSKEFRHTPRPDGSIVSTGPSVLVFFLHFCLVRVWWRLICFVKFYCMFIHPLTCLF